MNRAPAHPARDPIQRVHVIFKTHLDLGFTDLAARVADQYFDQFIPRALALARSMREGGGEDRFIWTTGAWLIFEYFERSNRAARRQLEAGIERGDIAWHGLPFTTHTELMNATLFRHGLSLSRRLDQRFGRTTIAAKMTDVPGHTRAMIPLLVEAGIQFLHLGVNPGSTAPAVPELFRWRHPGGGEVLVMIDKADYGQTSPVPAASMALTFAHTRDNEGPQTEDEVSVAMAELRSQFPAARVHASTLDDCARNLLPHSNQFPLVTSEIGDSWIHGAAADPGRVTPYRALSRLYQQWIDEDRLDPLRDDLDQFARTLMLIPEHTWGLMIEKLDDTSRYEGTAFNQLRNTAGAMLSEQSWDEQRSYVGQAINSLRDADAIAAAHDVVQATQAVRSSRDGYAATAARAWQTDRLELAIDNTGAISRLIDRSTGKRWATDSHPLGRFTFAAFSWSDYEKFLEDYVTLPDVEWAQLGFAKQGMDRSIPHATWHPELTECLQRSTAKGLELQLGCQLPEPTSRRFGAPRYMTAEIFVPNDCAELNMDVQWFDKQACRLPAACWLGFRPLVGDAHGWQLHIMGDWISPLDVVPQGGRMHGVERGVRYAGDDGTLYIDSLDATVVAPGKQNLLDFHDCVPDVAGGMHFCLWNNVWNTNFPYWHEGDERFRFRLQFA